MELTQIRYFLSIAEHTSFTRAAEYLHVSQPTISKQVALMEDELGVKLFTRNNRAVALTESGRAVHAGFKEAVNIIDRAVQSLKAREGVEGQIVIGIGRMMNINQVLPKFLHTFAQNYPLIELSIISDSFPGLKARLDAAELDIIFTYNLGTMQSGNYNSIPINRSHSYLYYASTLMPKGAEAARLKDFADKTMLKLREDDPSQTEDYFTDVAMRAGYTHSKILEVPDMETMILYLESGLGFCIMGKSYRINLKGSIRTIDLSASDNLLSVGTDAVWRKSNKNPLLTTLCDSLRNYVAAGRTRAS